jgi:uroporphyrinogen III methyltransferase/synthase
MNIKIGTRDSALALVQAKIAICALQKVFDGIKTEIIPLKTKGDILKALPLDYAGAKKLWTEELDSALLEGRLDMAVHSLKDIPAFLPSGLVISAYFDGEDPRDALVLPKGFDFCKNAPAQNGKPVGCSSKRRATQLESLYPGVRCALVRGNVPTRLERLDEGEYSALVLAVAGLSRLGLKQRASRIFEVNEMLPAAGQGILAIVTREQGEAAEMARAINNDVLCRRAMAERAFIRALDGGCGLPVAAYAKEDKTGVMLLEGGFCKRGETKMITASLRGAPSEHLGTRLAARLLCEAAKQAGGLGCVALVGAGPGDAGLLTIRAKEALFQADAVVFDRLVGAGVLAQIPCSAQKIAAGKEKGCHTMPQQEINMLLIKLASEGKRVVRLKGGDPFLLGRGSEEALACADAGVPFELISGVPSVLAVSAAAGIPVTHRGISSRVHIVAAHGEGAQSIDYKLLAGQCAAGDTLIFLMGAYKLEQIAEKLILAGLSEKTPAAFISNGTTAKQTVKKGTLSSFKTPAASPALFIAGGVCSISDALESAKKPLCGIRVAVTRPRGGENRLAKLLDKEGAEVIEIPTIRIVARKETPDLKALLNKRLDRHWFAFTSSHGVDVFFEKLAEYKVDIRALALCRFAAASSSTEAALCARGIIADLVPYEASGKALGELLAKNAAKDETVILPRSSIGGSEITDVLCAAKIAYTDIPIYDTLLETGYENPVFRARLCDGIDYVAFTSPSGVEGWIKIFVEQPVHSVQQTLETEAVAVNFAYTALCIGERTAACARSYGIKTITPLNTTIEGMIELLKQHCLKE